MSHLFVLFSIILFVMADEKDERLSELKELDHDDDHHGSIDLDHLKDDVKVKQELDKLASEDKMEHLPLQLGILFAIFVSIIILCSVIFYFHNRSKKKIFAVILAEAEVNLKKALLKIDADGYK